jgi:hypothetical protein
MIKKLTTQNSKLGKEKMKMIKTFLGQQHHIFLATALIPLHY